MTCTRRGAAVINQHAVQVLFANRNKRPKAVIPADYQENPENYNAKGQLRTDRAPLPSDLTVYVGLRVVLTRNQDKENHFANGMVATVEAFNPAARSLRVMTDSGRRLAVYPYTDVDAPGGRVVYFPVRLATRARSTSIRAPSWSMSRCGWTGPTARPPLTSPYRVSRDSDYLIGGEVTTAHFAPAK